MINYNPKDWLTFIIRINKADTFRKLLPQMIAVSIYAGIIAYIELEYWKVAYDNYVKNLTLMHNMLGFVISLLLVFRTNTAYDRWWEGRKQWGQLTNVSRTISIKLHAFLADADDRKFFALMIPNFATALKNHLRENEDYHELDPVLDIKPGKHLPNQISSAIYKRVFNLHQESKINSEQLIVLNQELNAFTEVCGACERIKNTPIPYSYSEFIKKFIFLYVLTLPFGWVFSLGYFIIPVIVFILYAFASLEIIAEEIENPFGTDANDLPIDSICINIKKHVKELLD
jgi:putative membrane protein